MNRFLQMAGTFLESVDQRADRSVNAAQHPTYITRPSEPRPATSISTSNTQRSVPNARNRVLGSPRRAHASHMMRRIGSSTSASKVKELEVNALLDTLNEPTQKELSSEGVTAAPSQGKAESAAVTRAQPAPSAPLDAAKDGNPESLHWEDENTPVGLLLSPNLGPTPTSAVPAMTQLEANSPLVSHPAPREGTPLELSKHIEDLECDLDVALGEIEQKEKDLENKQIRIDILENKLKQTQIDMAREQKKSEELLDEKDALIMRLQSEKEQMKAEACKLQLQWNEEKARQAKGSEQAEQEAGEVQRQLKQIVAENEELKKKALEGEERWRREEARLQKTVADQTAKMRELTNEVEKSQKQVESYYLRMETRDEHPPEMEEKVAAIERELLKVHQEADRLKSENELLREAKAQAEGEHARAVQALEAKVAEAETRVKACEQEAQQKNANQSSGVQMLQRQLETLQQTVLKKQLLLDAMKSEKNSLEYRLADALRDKARVESLHSASVSHGAGWSDPELGLADEKVHRRPISRLLPDFVPESVLNGVDSVDEVYTGFVQLMEKSPSLRVLVCVYLVCLHVGFLILFFRRK
ncbi:hypothetical protein WA577_006219, partial [Blastocystis sp. JDR]